MCKPYAGICCDTNKFHCSYPEQCGELSVPGPLVARRRPVALWPLLWDDWDWSLLVCALGGMRLMSFVRSSDRLMPP
jgi:hypothetical protein